MSGERRNNPADMSINEQIEAIKQDVCDKVCRWTIHCHDLYLSDEIENPDDYLAENYCASCPLTKL